MLDMTRKNAALVVAGAATLLGSAAAFAPSTTTVLQRTVVPSTCTPHLTALRADVRKDADGRLRKSTAEEETDLNGFANPMAKGAYVEDGWVDEDAGPGFFERLFGGANKAVANSEIAKQEELKKQLDVIEFLDGSKGSLTQAARGGTAVPFGGLNPAQVEAYDVDGQKFGDDKKPWGGYANMPESAIEFFIKYPDQAPKDFTPPLPDGWYSAEDETSGQTYYYKDDGTTTWERPE